MQLADREPRRALQRAQLLRTTPILGFGAEAWSDYWQTRQHVLSRLARRGWPVGYSYGALSVWDRASPRWTHAGLFDRIERRDGVKVFWPGRLAPRWPRWADWDRYAIGRYLDAYVGSMLTSPHQRCIAYVFRPEFHPYVSRLTKATIVYHVDDNFAAMPGWDGERARMHAALAARADVVFAISDGVIGSLPEAVRPRALLMPNGADAAAFSAARSAPCPVDLAAVPPPRIGYTGTLNEKVDFALIAALARARPQWHWAMIGHELPDAYLSDPARDARADCHSLPNVHFLGVKSWNALPAYCAHMDVCAMCYRTDGDGWWRDISPLKLHEYLATGRPVVSASLSAVRPFSHVVAIADGRDGWIGAIQHALGSGGEGRSETRIATAFENDWDRRIGQIEDALATALPVAPA